MSVTPLRILAFVASLLLLSVGPLLLARSSLQEQDETALLLQQLATIESRLDEATLRARIGFDPDWDQLVALEQSLGEAQAKLMSYLERQDPRTRASLDPHAKAYLGLSARRQEIVERFKSEYAVLRNSSRYLPTIAKATLSESRKVGEREAIMRVRVMKQVYGEAEGEPEPLIHELNEVIASTGESDTSALATFARHARIAIRSREAVEALLAGALSHDSERALAELRSAFEISHAALQRRSAITRAAWAALAVLLGGGVGHVTLRLRRDTATLARVNATLEQRVRERTAELEREVDHRRLAEEKAKELALFDELTNLPNRRLFRERLDYTMLHRKRDGGMAAILFLDLDGFKQINDKHGHDQGDALLIEVANRLTRCVRKTDSISRIAPGIDEDVVSRQGGDEFVILAAHVRAAEDAARIARRVIEVITRPILLGEVQVKVGASVGIALYPLHGESGDALMKSADTAMYQVKTRDPGSFAFFDEEMGARVVEQLRLEAELQHGIRESQLVLHYQPKMLVATGSVESVEALVRWHHPTRGLMLPNAFVAVAEKSDLINQLGCWVIEKACGQAAEWWRKERPLRISVNVSAPQLRTGEFAERLAALQRAAELPAELLELEITESCLLDDADAILARLRRLREHGVQMTLDDFGTGYSSLGHLRTVPLDWVKIDRSLVEELDASAGMIGAVVQVAHAVGLRVVAEGVEDGHQLRRLVALGCDALQGYYFAPPVPVGDLDAAYEQATARFAEQIGSWPA